MTGPGLGMGMSGTVAYTFNDSQYDISIKPPNCDALCAPRCAVCTSEIGATLDGGVDCYLITMCATGMLTQYHQPMAEDAIKTRQRSRDP